jgi:hypothetical protein
MILNKKKNFFFIIELVHLIGINYSSLKDHLVKFNICKFIFVQFSYINIYNYISIYIYIYSVCYILFIYIFLKKVPKDL